MPSLIDTNLEKSLEKNKQYFEKTALPIVTVSASFKEDLKGFEGFVENETIQDVVFSRAHYSMAAGILVEAWGNKIAPEKAWVVDPTNYVSDKNWRSIQITEIVGKTLARNPILKKLKDLVDKFGRSKLPILSSITPPLLHLTQNVKKPILSFHIAAGNILAEHGKTIVQVITDPHVRDEYLNNADKPNFTLCVFDENTKTEALEKAAIMGKEIDPQKIIVTGPPIDPRILAARTKKNPWRNGPLNICITTGGLGTNKKEIKDLMRQLLPELRKRPSPYRVLLYSGTHPDICDMVRKMAKQASVKVGKIDNDKEELRLLHHPQIVDANELLIKYGFPWADGFITKPSGDMAYDAVTSGSFLLTLEEWGEWEHNIREIFEQEGIARRAKIENITEQLEALTDSKGSSQSWVEKAMNNTHLLDKLYFSGAKNIIKAVENLSPSRAK